MMFLFFILCFCANAQGSPLDDMFKTLTTQSHRTKPGAFQDQAAGYYTGGGFAMRNGNQSLRLVRLSLPHIGASCRGIDAYFGAFSFIKGDQLVQMLRNMGSQAASYAFQLGLKTMAPSVENILSQLRKLALDANKLAIDDCHMVQQLFTAALPKGSAALEQACMDVNSQGSSSDWFGARKKCQEDQGAKDASVSAYREKSPDLMMGEYNLTWHALMKVLSHDPPTAHFILSVVGTVISRKEGDKYRIHVISGKGDDAEFIQAYMKGKTTKLLVCDTPQCLNPTWQESALEDNLFEKVARHIHAITQKYRTKGELTPEEENFLQEGQKTPLYKYIQVSAAAGTPFLMEDAVEYITLSVLLAQFDAFASRVLHYMNDLQALQLEDAHIQMLKQNIQELRVRIHQLQTRSDNGTSFRLLKMIQAYERKISAEKGL